MTDPGRRRVEDDVALAGRWVDADDPLPLSDAGAALKIAWDIKQVCYAAWSTEPQRARRSADAVERLLLSLDGLRDVEPATRTEIGSIASWTRAIAQLTEGAMAEAVASLDLASAGLDAVGRSAEAAQTRVPRVMALSMLGRHDEAVACATDAKRRFVELADWRSAAKTSLNLGSLQLRHDAYAEAARHYGEASVLFARAQDREHSVMADIGTADALTALGRTEDAAHLYARARMRATTHRLPVLEALVDESMALLDLVTGRYADALRGLESARRRYEGLGMPQHLAIAEKQLADAYLELRLLPEALALYDAALPRMRALEMPDDEAWTLVQRGRALALCGAGEAAREAFAGAYERFGAQGLDVGRSAVDLALAELSLAERDPDAAIERASRAATGFVNAGLVGAALRAEITQAEAALAAGRPSRPRFEVLLARARETRMASAEVRCLVGIGAAAELDQEFDSARAAYVEAIEQFEDQRRVLPADDVRMAFLTDHLRPYEAMLRLALESHRHLPDQATATEVLGWLDRTRARSLTERLARGRDVSIQPPLSPASPQPAADTSAALRSRHQWLTRRLQQQQQDGEPASALEAERSELERQLLELARRDRLVRSPTGSEPSQDTLDHSLQARLSTGEALVEFGVSDGELFAVVVRSDHLRVVEAIAPMPAVRDRLRSLRFQIDTMRHGSEHLAAHMHTLTARTRAHLHALHDLVWRPLAESLEDCARVAVVPASGLAAVPFSALLDGDEHLGVRHEIVIAPSASWAVRALASPLRHLERALVVANADRLEHVQAEAAVVAACFPVATRLEGAAATIASLHEHAGTADLLHLACHAEFRNDNPLFSALHLHDGALTAEQAESLPLRPGLVVLSACETARSVEDAGDEHVGLVRAFLIAGASRVVATLWPVGDQVTALFMQAFYEALVQDVAPAKAMQLAQAQVRQRHAHPWHWAGFVLYGGW